MVGNALVVIKHIWKQKEPTFYANDGSSLLEDGMIKIRRSESIQWNVRVCRRH